MEALKLHDIKGLVEIPDNSFYYFLLTLFLAVLALGLIIYFVIKYLKKEKAEKLQKVYLNALNKIDMNDSKVASYELCHFAQLLDKDEAQSHLFELLVLQLEKYKYQKNVPAFYEEDSKAIHRFLEAINAK